MARSNARRKPIIPLKREPNGRAQRDRQETVAEVLSVVTAQPHRRDFADPRAWHLENQVGRMVESGVLATSIPKASLLEAAKRYSADWDAYRRTVMYTRRPLAVVTGRMPIDDAEREERAKRNAERAWGDVSRALRDQGEPVEKAMQMVVLDYQDGGWTPPFWIIHNITRGLRALVLFYGLEA